MALLRLPAHALHDLERSSRLEWLLTDGRGGYAASTVIGANTRREHGLLVVATRSPVERLLLVSRFEEALVVEGGRHELSTNFYPGAVHPRGYTLAREFVLDPLPRLTWEAGPARLTRTLVRLHGAPALLVAYHYDGPPAAQLELRPLIAWRDPSDLRRAEAPLRCQALALGDAVGLPPQAGGPPLRLRVPGGSWRAEPLWYRDFEYERDRERGRAFREDLWSPGVFQVALSSGRSVYAWALAGDAAEPEPEATLAAQRQRLREAAGDADGVIGTLRRAAEQLTITWDAGGGALLDGFPPGPPDAAVELLAVPGLLVGPGRSDDALRVLTTQAEALWQRRVTSPGGSALPAPSEPAEVALALAIASNAWAEAVGERTRVAPRLARAVTLGLEGLVAGTLAGAHLDADGLLWTDRSILRHSLATAGQASAASARSARVEAQALWYNALLAAADSARRSGRGDAAARWTSLAARVRDGFLRRFWDEARGWLADSVGPQGTDPTLRPWQAYAVGLPHALLPREPASRVVEAVGRLLTPFGLRGATSGDEAQASWPAVAAVWAEALVRVHGEEGKRQAREWLRGFGRRLEQGAVGFVGTGVEAAPPHRPVGRVVETLSVAELLRLAQRLGRVARLLERGRPSTARRR